MKKTNHPMKKRRGESGRFLQGRVFVLGFSVLALSLTLHAGSRTDVSAAPLVDNERNRLAESVGPEIYNAPSYQAMEKEIRHSLQSDPLLSVEARRVTVSVREGTITLRGAVENSRERDKILSLSKEVGGMARIDDQLQVRFSE